MSEEEEEEMMELRQLSLGPEETEEEERVQTQQSEGKAARVWNKFVRASYYYSDLIVNTRDRRILRPPPTTTIETAPIVIQSQLDVFAESPIAQNQEVYGSSSSSSSSSEDEAVEDSVDGAILTKNFVANRGAAAPISPTESKEQLKADDDLDGGPEIIPRSSSFHVPIFIPLISMVELGVFLYHVVHLQGQHCLTVTDNGPVPYCSVLIYNPYRRYEPWRLITYMLVHGGYLHIGSNITIQILLGIPLEIVHGPWRIMPIYLSGVLTGALVTSVSDPSRYLLGASGGVYALLIAHLPTTIMNWREMKTFLEWMVTVLVLAFGLFDVGTQIYNRYFRTEGNGANIGTAAHLGGAIAGLLVGMNVLRNIRVERWENILRCICWILWMTGLAALVLVNACAGDALYPETDWTPITEECDYYMESGC